MAFVGIVMMSKQSSVVVVEKRSKLYLSQAVYNMLKQGPCYVIFENIQYIVR